MKSLAAIVALSLGLTTLANAQNVTRSGQQMYRDGKPWYRIPTPEEEKQRRMQEIEKQVAEYAKTKSPYRKFEDGEIVYLGKMLYEKNGLIPRTTNSTASASVKLEYRTYRVLDVTSAGCRIEFINIDSGTGLENSEPDIFVEPLAGYSDRKYRDTLIMKHVGDYQYKTVNGATRLIPKYSLGKDATKEEYLEYVAKQSKKP